MQAEFLKQGYFKYANNYSNYHFHEAVLTTTLTRKVDLIFTEHYRGLLSSALEFYVGVLVHT